MKQPNQNTRFENFATSATELLKAGRRYVRKHPWQTAGVALSAAGAAAALGYALRGSASSQFALPLVPDEPAPRRKSTRRSGVAVTA